MSSDYTRAAIHLHAVLRNLEELCTIDGTARSLVSGKERSVGFVIRGGPRAWLSFAGGACIMSEREGPGPIRLLFRSTGHFNRMMEGRGSPIPLGGFTRLGFLTTSFKELTKRLEHYLKPVKTQLDDPDFFRHHTRLLLNTAIYAVACIGNHDPVGQQIAKRIPDGVIAIRVKESGQEVFLQARGGSLTALKAAPEPAKSFMTFGTVQDAYDALSGQAGIHELIVRERLLLKGLLPMIQHMGDILAMVPGYLS